MPDVTKYSRHAAMYRAAVLRYRASRRRVIQEAKARPCMDCGVEYPPFVMDFDHRGDKVRAVSQMTSMSLERIAAEIAKCDVVCSNCHRVRTETRGRKT